MFFWVLGVFSRTRCMLSKRLRSADFGGTTSFRRGPRTKKLIKKYINIYTADKVGL